MQWSFSGDDKLADYLHLKAARNDGALLAASIYRKLKREKGMVGQMMKYAILSKHESRAIANRVGFIAYTIHPMPIVHMACIKKDHRTDEVKTETLKALDKMFEGLSYAFSLNIHNTRAIRFLENNGFTQRKTGKPSQILLCKSV